MDDKSIVKATELKENDCFSMAGQLVEVSEILSIEGMLFRVRVRDQSGKYVGFIQVRANQEFELISRG